MSHNLRMLSSVSSLELSLYRDQQFNGSNDELEKLLRESSLLYVGNLSFYTTEDQIYKLFGRCGDIKNVFMGLDKIKTMACGFCFVKYYNRADAENAMWFLNGAYLDDHILRMDWDLGFREGRLYRRGGSGGQVRDEFREDFDAGRGGLGKQAEAHDRRGTHKRKKSSGLAP